MSAIKDPSEEVYTAQAGTTSVLGFKYAQMSRWETILHAPFPEEFLVVVRPPRAWVRVGFV